MDRRKRPVDFEIADLASSRDGVVARRQLLVLGLTPAAIDSRVRRGRLHVVFPGVYAVGHRRIGRLGRWRAAVLACGERAVLSHRSAAALHGIAQAHGRIVDVTTPDRDRHGHEGIRLHRVRQLAPDQVTEVDGIPATTVARTLADLAAAEAPDRTRRAWQEAERLRLLDVAAVTALASQPRRGARTLRALIAAAADVPPTRSELEHRFADLIVDHGLPTPLYNAPLLGYVVDAFWPAHRLVVELDSRAYHWHRHEQDRARDADLVTAGYRVYRLTWARLRDEPRTVAGQLRRLLA